MGAVFVKKEIHDAFMAGPEHMIEFFHGYTYSGCPVAAVAALVTRDIFEQEDLVARAAKMAPAFQEAVWLRDVSTWASGEEMDVLLAFDHAGAGDEGQWLTLT